MSKKLFVFGCSYSDRTEVEKAYGDYVSEITGLEYHHCAKGATSNDRTWRMATRMIIDGEITPNDVVIVQYTDRHRREFGSHGIGYDHIQERIEHARIDEPDKNHIHHLDRSHTECGTFYTSNYKMDSYIWYNFEPDKTLHRTYQNTCVIDEFDNEYFITRHKQFESFCEANNIKLVMLWCRLSDLLDEYNILGPYARKYLINEENIIPTTPPMCYKYELGLNQRTAENLDELADCNVWDLSHLSDLGHSTIGKYIAAYLQRHSLV
jgi:hypothetical protein